MVRCGYYEANRCRSCTLLPLPYDEQVARKRDAVAGLLPGPEITWLDPVTSAQSRFRNKAKLVVGGTATDPVLGINSPGGPPGTVTDLTSCPLHEEAIEAALPALKTFITTATLTPYDVRARSGELKFLLVTANPAGELMVRFVLRSTEAQARIRKHLPALLAALPKLAVVSVNVQPAHAAVLEGDTEVVVHGTTLTMPVNGLGLHLRPRSFFQTNTAVAAALYRQATAWLTDLAPSRLWDLYCGVGGFALHAARALPGTQVLGVEVSAEAVASAAGTARDNGLDNATFRALDAGEISARDPHEAPDAVVVNPPRRGIGALAPWLEDSTARHVVYSSCNATSLARDLAAMPSLRLVRAQVLDMFPHTGHYEVLTLLTRG